MSSGNSGEAGRQLQAHQEKDSGHVKAFEPPSPIESMKEERQSIPFDVREMTYIMAGGKSEALLREKFMLELERDPAFELNKIHDHSKEMIRENTMEKFERMVSYITTESIAVFQKRMEMVGVCDPGFWTRFGVHYGLFLGALRGQATANQFSYWMERGVLTLNGVIGCFCMTELGHGSNVAGLETTATFDRSTDEFIIHTPWLQATKWWIGGAASTANTGAVFAQLIVDGKKYGTKTFIVPLRDPKTHHLLPGINIGDIGRKMGRDGIDNGWVQFTNVRIPRAFMLMKHTQVQRDGTVNEPQLAQLTYGALLQGRTAMVTDAGNIAKKALVIGVRYGAVRRQFSSNKDSKVETKILDYPIHQRRLMPILAQGIAMGFTGLEMTKLYEEMTQKLESASSGDDDEATKELLEKLKETHSTSAGLKAFCTWATLSTIDACRQACGGHGYSSYANLAAMYSDHAVQCTWEGDNTILALQSGRYLIGCYIAAADHGTKMASGVAYLNQLPGILSAKCKRDVDIENFEKIDEAWACIAANVVKKAAHDYADLRKQGMNKEAAFEQCSQVRFVAAKIHSFGYIYRQFVAGIQHVQGRERAALDKVCRLYGLWAIEDNAAMFLQYEYFSPQQMNLISTKVNALCAEIRKMAIGLTDAFNFSDHIINSPLGCYDGDVYRRYFNLVRNNNPLPKVHPYFDRLIKPLLERRPDDEADPDSIDIDSELQEMEDERKEQEEEQKAGKDNAQEQVEKGAK